MHRWRRLYTPLEIVLATVCYFHEAQAVAKNSSKQLICLLDVIVPFHLDFTVYTTLCLTAPISMGPWHWNNLTWFVSVMDMTALVRNANLWTELGTVRQHRTTTKRISQPNFAYITQPISRSLTVRGIFPCPVANGIEIKRNTRHAARTASTCFGTSTILLERWRHIASTLIEMSIDYTLC